MWFLGFWIVARCMRRGGSDYHERYEAFLLHRGSRVVVYIDAWPKPGLTYKIMTERVWVEYKRRKEVEIITLYSNSMFSPERGQHNVRTCVSCDDNLARFSREHSKPTLLVRKTTHSGSNIGSNITHI